MQLQLVTLTVLFTCRLSYKGLGEPLCFLAFGPLATSAFYLAQVNPVLLTLIACLTAWYDLPKHLCMPLADLVRCHMSEAGQGLSH